MQREIDDASAHWKIKCTEVPLGDFVGRPIFLGFQSWKLKKNGEKERDLERKKKITLRKQNRTKEKEDLAFCFGGSQLVRSRNEITVPG